MVEVNPSNNISSLLLCSSQSSNLGCFMFSVLHQTILPVKGTVLGVIVDQSIGFGKHLDVINGGHVRARRTMAVSLTQLCFRAIYYNACQSIDVLL